MITIFAPITDMKRTSDHVYRCLKIIFLSGCSASSPGRKVSDDEKTVQDNIDVIDVGLAIEWEYASVVDKMCQNPKLLKDSVRAKLEYYVKSFVIMLKIISQIVHR